MSGTAGPQDAPVLQRLVQALANVRTSDEQSALANANEFCELLFAQFLPASQPLATGPTQQSQPRKKKRADSIVRPTYASCVQDASPAAPLPAPPPAVPGATWVAPAARPQGAPRTPPTAVPAAPKASGRPAQLTDDGFTPTANNRKRASRPATKPQEASSYASFMEHAKADRADVAAVSIFTNFATHAPVSSPQSAAEKEHNVRRLYVKANRNSIRDVRAAWRRLGVSMHGIVNVCWQDQTCLEVVVDALHEERFRLQVTGVGHGELVTPPNVTGILWTPERTAFLRRVRFQKTTTTNGRARRFFASWEAEHTVTSPSSPTSTPPAPVQTSPAPSIPRQDPVSPRTPDKAPRPYPAKPKAAPSGPKASSTTASPPCLPKPPTDTPVITLIRERLEPALPVAKTDLFQRLWCKHGGLCVDMNHTPEWAESVAKETALLFRQKVASAAEPVRQELLKQALMTHFKRQVADPQVAEEKALQLWTSMEGDESSVQVDRIIILVLTEGPPPSQY
jgi:hypothetical protein